MLVKAVQLCGLLAEPDRLAAFAAVVLGARTVEQVATVTGLPARQVTPALRRLRAGGLVTMEEEGLVAAATPFKTAVRESIVPEPPPQPLDVDPQRDAVLRTFISDGRLTQLPAARGKRRIVLRHIVATFEPGVKYPEREVDAALRAWHDDYVTLRRYLIDEELMARESGIYWRTG